jgi:hypothetical protein
MIGMRRIPLGVWRLGATGRRAQAAAAASGEGTAPAKIIE